MVDKRYGIPFVAALVVNIVYWGVVGDFMSRMQPLETPHKDLVITLDMGQIEPPPEKKEIEKSKVQPDDKPVAGGGKAGSVLPDLSGKPTEGLKNLNPYLGGNEPAPVNLKGNNDNPVGNLGGGNVPGLNNGPTGNNGNSIEGPGSVEGPPGPGETKSEGGIFDDSDYLARVRHNRVMPEQARRRGITGVVILKVYFDGEGNYLDADFVQRSGSSILDNAARSLVASSGGATNTTGEPQSSEVTIIYNLD